MRDSLVPIATQYEIPFFLGIITSKLDVPGFLSREEVQEISKNPLMSISSHSVNHIDNSKLSLEEETKEMCESKQILEEITSKKIETYIYPSGRFDTIISPIAAEKCGYKIAWSTRYGKEYNIQSESPYTMNRVRISSGTESIFFDMILSKYEESKRLKE
jgi:peptidoglycan/xylan/chitin deacetylase (PgdA/CDA1 family)